MNLLVQPQSGFEHLVSAIKRATTRIDIVIFRFDIKEVQKALEAAVQRGVAVHALIAHTNLGGEKRLRKLELDRRREVGVIVRDPKVIRQFKLVYEGDWGLTGLAKAANREARQDGKSSGKEEGAHETVLAAK